MGKRTLLLLSVAVPVVAPRLSVVAAPPILSVVAFALNRFPVEVVVVSEPPLAARLPLDVILPVANRVPLVEIFPLEPVIEKLEPTKLEAPRAIPVVMCESVKSIPVVMVPPPVDVIFNPAGNVFEAFALSIWISWFGTAVLEPEARENKLSPVEPFAVVTVKLEAVDVFASVKSILSLLFVVMVLPLLYAVCKVDVPVEQVETWLEPSRQSEVVPVLLGILLRIK